MLLELIRDLKNFYVKKLHEALTPEFVNEYN